MWIQIILTPVIFCEPSLSTSSSFQGLRLGPCCSKSLLLIILLLLLFLFSCLVKSTSVKYYEFPQMQYRNVNARFFAIYIYKASVSFKDVRNQQVEQENLFSLLVAWSQYWWEKVLVKWVRFILNFLHEHCWALIVSLNPQRWHGPPGYRFVWGKNSWLLTALGKCKGSNSGSNCDCISFCLSDWTGWIIGLYNAIFLAK